MVDGWHGSCGPHARKDFAAAVEDRDGALGTRHRSEKGCLPRVVDQRVGEVPLVVGVCDTQSCVWVVVVGMVI